MGFRFNLPTAAQLILRIVLESAQEEFPDTLLNQAFHFFYPMEAGFSAALNTYTTKFAETNSISEKRLIEKEVSGLEYVGLVNLTIAEKVKRKKKKSTSTTRRSKPKPPSDEDMFHSYKIKLTEEGKRIAQAVSENRRLIFRPKETAQNSIFIACAFGKPEIDTLSDRHLIPACAKLGYKSIRVDRSEPDRTITELIMQEITQSAAMLADLTYARPSVYFEIGYALGLGIPIILSCREDHYRGIQDDLRVHFDLEQYKISFWKLDEDGEYKWSNKSLEPNARLAEVLQPRQ